MSDEMSVGTPIPVNRATPSLLNGCPTPSTCGQDTLSNRLSPLSLASKISCPVWPHLKRSDMIHGIITIKGGLARKIIDSEPFQRLNDINQLGPTYFIYTSARHSRAAHSLGVYYLATKVAEDIAGVRPDLGISPRDIELLGAAALCHDLGHGPALSHAFDDYIKLVTGSAWSHENMTFQIMDYMRNKNILDVSGEEMKFLKECIKPNTSSPPSFKKRSWRILSKLISSDTIDVDRIDYIMRDAHNTNVAFQLKASHILEYIAIINTSNDDKTPVDEIHYHVDAGIYIKSFFSMRYNLHKTAYQDQAVVSIGIMMIEALQLVDKEFGISGSILDVEKFIKLDDGIVGEIRRRVPKQGADDNLRAAQEIIRRIYTNDIYKLIIEKKFKDNELAETCRMSIQDALDKNELNKDFILKTGNINHGAKEKDPMSMIKLFRGMGSDGIEVIDDPSIFDKNEATFYIWLRLYSKNTNADVRMASGLFTDTYEFHLKDYQLRKEK